MIEELTETVKELMPILPWTVATFAMVAGICWWRTAVVVVLAPRDASMGALLGGGLITKDAKGRKIDLHQTLKAQARWNRNAAIAASVSAFATVLELALKKWLGL